jgi:hypothetical protein
VKELAIAWNKTMIKRFLPHRLQSVNAPQISASVSHSSPDRALTALPLPAGLRIGHAFTAVEVAFAVALVVDLVAFAVALVVAFAVALVAAFVALVVTLVAFAVALVVALVAFTVALVALVVALTVALAAAFVVFAASAFVVFTALAFVVFAGLAFAVFVGLALTGFAVALAGFGALAGFTLGTAGRALAGLALLELSAFTFRSASGAPPTSRSAQQTTRIVRNVIRMLKSVVKQNKSRTGRLMKMKVRVGEV